MFYFFPLKASPHGDEGLSWFILYFWNMVMSYLRKPRKDLHWTLR